MKKIILLCAVLLMTSSGAFAQVLDSPTDKLRITWPAANVSADGLDAPSGIRVTAVNPTQTGVVIRTWDVGPTATSIELTPAQLPTGMFSVTVAPFNNFGAAGGTAPVGPFGKMTVPKSLPQATGAVVEGGSASLEKPASGVEASISTRTSTASTIRISRDASGRLYVYRTDENGSLSGSSPQEMLSASGSQTSSQNRK